MDLWTVVKFILVILVVVLAAVYLQRRQSNTVVKSGAAEFPLDVRVITWNLGDAAKKVKNWRKYLSEWDPITKADYDVLCFTVQEAPNSLGVGKHVSKILQNDYRWYYTINYGPPNVVKKPFSVQTHVYVRRSLGRVTVLRDSVTHQGVPIYMNTKSSALLTLEFDNSRLVFIGSHLPVKPKADDMGFESRVSAVTDIERTVGKMPTDRPTAIFWAGDLNFRANTPADGVHRKDQLTYWLSTSDTKFQEEPIRFDPTCKLMTGAVRKHDPARIPSHCDRVLYQAHGLRVVPSEYSSYRGSGIEMSDHDAVILTAKIDV